MLDTAWSALSKYRLERAEEMLKTARRDLDAGDYASANNRAYYCIFHAMRATLALTGEDYKKHSGVISRFSEQYLKTKLESMVKHDLYTIYKCDTDEERKEKARIKYLDMQGVPESFRY